MPTTIFDASVRDAIVQRLHTLTPERKPRWGSMSAPAMISHLIESCRMALGDLPVKAKASPLQFFPLNWLVVHWMPWPKSVPTAPELIARAPGAWERDVDELIALVRRFSECTPARRWPEHPAFGALSCDSWGVLVYRHIDHHLEQFGI